MSILIVDDASLLRETLISYLAEAGYTAVGAADGNEALRCLRAQSFRFVLSDVWMPVMDGRELLQAIHADSALAAIPVVMMTTDETLREHLLEQGACAYLSKPIDLSELIGIIQYYVRNGDRV